MDSKIVKILQSQDAPKREDELLVERYVQDLIKKLGEQDEEHSADVEGRTD